MLRSNSKIVVQWDGAEFLFNRVMLIARPVSLKVVFGFVRGDQFAGKAEAVFPYSQHPEIKHIHDGCSWDLGVISQFLDTLALKFDEGDVDQPAWN